MILTYEQIENSKFSLGIIGNSEFPKDLEGTKHLVYCISKNVEALNKLYPEIQEEKQSILESYASEGKPDQQGKIEWTFKSKEDKKKYNDEIKKFLAQEVEVRIRKIDYDKYPLVIPALQLLDLNFMFNFPEDYDKEE